MIKPILCARRVRRNLSRCCAPALARTPAHHAQHHSGLTTKAWQLSSSDLRDFKPHRLAAGSPVRCRRNRDIARMVVDGHLFSLRVKSSIYLDANGRRLVTLCIGLLQTGQVDRRWAAGGTPDGWGREAGWRNGGRSPSCAEAKRRPACIERSQRTFGDPNGISSEHDQILFQGL